MAHESAPAPRPPTEPGQHRWEQVLHSIAGMLPRGDASVVVDGGGQSVVVADRLAATLRAAGRPCARLTGTDDASRTDPSPADAFRTDSRADDGAAVALGDGPHWRANPPRNRWDVVVWLRTAPTGQGDRVRREDGEVGADIVVDLHDPAWPVIRHVATTLAERGSWYVAETRAFFGPKAATWDTRFGDDLPAYAAAIAEAGIPRDGVVADVGCGTGRALPALRTAVGPGGRVMAFDLTPEMLVQARVHGRGADAALVVADARALPLAADRVDALFAAGLVMHLPDIDAGLRELGRVTRTGGRLVLFHPSGRAALAARHGRTLKPDDPLAPEPLSVALTRTGWCLERYDDAAHRFFALARRL